MLAHPGLRSRCCVSEGLAAAVSDVRGVSAPLMIVVFKLGNCIGLGYSPIASLQGSSHANLWSKISAKTIAGPRKRKLINCKLDQ